jgi:RTX calcium-binding nonapeptide repeat (4 copies)
MEKGTMRKTAATIMALVALFTLVVAGVAIAVTKTCSSVPCRGTPAADLLKERVGNGNRDVIIGGRGNDRLRAGRYTNDTDELHGGRGNDRLNVLDGDFRDRAVGGRGNDDFCLVDDDAELSASCEGFGIP